MASSFLIGINFYKLNAQYNILAGGPLLGQHDFQTEPLERRCVAPGAVVGLTKKESNRMCSRKSII